MADPTITFQYQYIIEVTTPSSTVAGLAPIDTFKVTSALDYTGPFCPGIAPDLIDTLA